MAGNGGDPAEDGGWTFSDVGHAALDVAGLVPGYGEAADLTNAVWYAGEDKYLEAGLSLISLVPVVGDAVGKGGKVALKMGGPAARAAVKAIKAIPVEKALGRFRSHPKLGPKMDKIIAAVQDWQARLLPCGKLAPLPSIKRVPTSGVPIVAKPGVTTTVLGKFNDDMAPIIKEIGEGKNVDFGAKPSGFNVLDVPDDLYKSSDQFWRDYNEPFLRKAVERGDEIIMATRPSPQSLYVTLPNGEKALSGFGREYQYLLENGYKYDPVSSKMVK